MFDGRHYVLERALHADFAFVKAWKGDSRRQPRLSAHRAQLQSDDGDRRAVHDCRGRAARRARRTSIRDLVHTPGIYVKRLFQGRDYSKRIEKRTVRNG